MLGILPGITPQTSIRERKPTDILLLSSSVSAGPHWTRLV